MTVAQSPRTRHTRRTSGPGPSPTACPRHCSLFSFPPSSYPILSPTSWGRTTSLQHHRRRLPFLLPFTRATPSSAEFRPQHPRGKHRLLFSPAAHNFIYLFSVSPLCVHFGAECRSTVFPPVIGVPSRPSLFLFPPVLVALVVCVLPLVSTVDSRVSASGLSSAAPRLPELPTTTTSATWATNCGNGHSRPRLLSFSQCVCACVLIRLWSLSRVGIATTGVSIVCLASAIHLKTYQRPGREGHSRSDACTPPFSCCSSTTPPTIGPALAVFQHQ